MKTLKMNRITNYLYLLFLTFTLATIPFRGLSQPTQYRDPSFDYLIATSDSRMVYTIEETDTTVKLRVMFIGPILDNGNATAITYDKLEFTVTDPTYTADVHYKSGTPTSFGNVDRSPKTSILYPNYEPFSVNVADHSVTSNRKYYTSTFSDPYYVGNVTLASCMQISQGELFPIYNMYFKKTTRSRMVTHSDFGFLRYPNILFLLPPNYHSQFGIAQLSIATSRGPVIDNRQEHANLFVYRSPSGVVTDPASMVEQYSAQLNADYKRGNLTPSNNMLFSTVATINESDTGRLNWDTIQHYGFLYSDVNVPIMVNDVSDSITVDGVTYPFPTTSYIAGLSNPKELTFGTYTFKVAEFENSTPDQYKDYNFPITTTQYPELNTYMNEYYVWSYLRYAFETSNTYLLVGDPVRFKKLIKCEELDNKTVVANQSGGYLHSGTTWDAMDHLTDVSLADSAHFFAAGATTGTGTTLAGFTFNLGTTYITWVAYEGDDLTDTCRFEVEVGNSFLNCAALVDQYVQEDGPGAGYTKVGTDWNIVKQPGVVLSDSTYFLIDTASGYQIGTGKDLDNATFDLGTTLVQWVGVEAGSNAEDTCEFYVTVNPKKFMDCTPLDLHYYVQEGVLGSKEYQHSGESWNIGAVTTPVTVTLASIIYEALGATPPTGDNLDTVHFPQGTTHVMWIGTDLGGYTDTCEFDVTVYPQNFLNCDALNIDPDTTVVETHPQGANGYYKHSGTDWDVAIYSFIDGFTDLTLDSSYYHTVAVTPGAGADAAQGNSLDTVHFLLGTTTVKWYGVIKNLGTGADFIDSCSFNVIVERSYIMECDSFAPVYYVQEDNAGDGFYTHHGTDWDPFLREREVGYFYISHHAYDTNGVTPPSSFTLDLAVFPLGPTTVRWVVTADGISDTCYFDVVVLPKDFLDCAALGGDKDTVETEKNGYYKHSGTDWDVTPISFAGLVIDTIYYVSDIAEPERGSTLDTVHFPIGTTHITWYGVDENGFTATCEFDVNVRPSYVMECDSFASVYYVREDTKGSGSYTHSGTDWDPVARDGYTFDSKDYDVSGATTTDGSNTLHNVVFQLGLNTVTWYVVDDSGIKDTCDFIVIVSPSFLNCAAMVDQNVQEDALGAGYTKVGTDWNIIKQAGIVLLDSNYILVDTATGLTIGTGGDDLDGVTFNVGTTLVKWAATEDGTLDKDTCEFYVTVTPKKFMNCTLLDPHYYVQEDVPGSQDYKHSGLSWNVGAFTTPPVALISIIYYAPGATPSTGTNLDTVHFPQGTTHVRWIGTAVGGSKDTCEFDVTVYPKNFLDCGALGASPKNVVETHPEGATGYYQHDGTGWDVEIQSAIYGFTDLALDSSYYHTSGAGADAAQGNSLDTVHFLLGTTTVEWFGVIKNLGTGADFIATCSFDVIVERSYIMECDSFAPVYYVQEDNEGDGFYTHSGSDWDPFARDGVTFSVTEFSTTGATTVTGFTTLNGVAFNVGGITHVEWAVEDVDGLLDTCSFDVYVSERKFLNCSTLGNQVEYENGATGFYTHSGSGWDVKALSGHLQDSLYVYNIAGVKQQGKTLHGKQFPVGTTHVTWYGWDANNFIDSCEFDVTIIPSKLLVCPSVNVKNAMETTPVGFYTHLNNSWNIQTRTDIPVTLTASAYQITTIGSTATLPTPPPATLNGATFPLGQTAVRYVVQAQYTVPGVVVPTTVYDTCEITVNIESLMLLNCAVAAMQPKHVGETAPMHGYDHTGFNWDAVIYAPALAAGLTITTHYEVTLPGGTTVVGTTGASLSGFNFPVGVSHVVWYAVDNYDRVRTCAFDVTVDQLPVAVLDCSGLANQTVGTDVAGSAIYTHAGTSWDALPGDPGMTILDELNYKLSGATTGTGAWTLDGVVFNLGKTTVTWTGKDQYGFIDSCKFVVTVNMTCHANLTYQGITYNITPLAGLCWTDNMANLNYDDNVGGGSITFAKPYTCPTCPAQLDTIFGLLYTWYSAVNVLEGSTTLPTVAGGHVQGICKEGTHIPSQAELNLLNSYPLDDLKSTQYWMVPGNNATGFNALPAGRFNGAIDRFEDMYGYTGWWTSTSITNQTSLLNFITYYCDGITAHELLKSDGLSVRCILDY